MIKEINSEFEVLVHDEKAKYSINKNKLKIDFYDEELILQVILKKINKKYHEILRMLANEDDSDEFLELVLLKIDDLKRLIMDKYYSYLGKKTISHYLKMLAILEDRAKSFVKKSSRGR